MLPKVALDRRGLMDLAVVRHHVDPMEWWGRISTVDDIQRVSEKGP
jgi:hypothetical protein